MTTEVITALIAGLTTLVVSVIGYKQTLKTKKLELELKGKDLIIKESNKNFAAFTMLMDFELISIIQERIDYIFQQTKIDRFLILIAVNGTVDPKVVSVIFEQHKDVEGNSIKVNAITRYRHLYVDIPYRTMLKNAEVAEGVYMEVHSMPDSYLKEIYTNEKVTSSLVKHIHRVPINEGNDMIIF